MNTHDLAWAAGFIDGEGSINMIPRKPSSHRSVSGRQVTLNISASNKCRDPLDYLKILFGGTVSENPNPLGVYVWRASSKKAYAVCEQLFPYLRVKQDQAALAIELYQTCLVKATGRRCLTQEELDFRWSYVERMRALNERYRIGPHWRRRREMENQRQQE